jgi:hypothetical protein
MTWQAVLQQAASGWKIGIAVAGVSAAVLAFNRVPTELHRHEVQTDSLLVIERAQLCLQVAQLRHDDWTKCLVP